MKLVSLPLGKALYESGDQFNHVYFPITTIMSLLYELENGSSAEIAVVGNEGIVGIALFMAGDTMPNRAVVQSAGHAYRLRGQLLQQEFNRGRALQHLLSREAENPISLSLATLGRPDKKKGGIADARIWSLSYENRKILLARTSGRKLGQF